MEPRVYAPVRSGGLSFLPLTFAWMTVGLLVSAAVAFVTITTPALLEMIAGNRLVLILAFVAQIGIVVALSAMINRLSTASAAVLFLAYSALSGVTLSLLLLVYTAASVVSVFGIAALTFAGMAVYGMTTKRDLTSMGSLLFMALIGLIVVSVVNIFLGSSALSWIISFAGVAIFVGLTAYDAQKLKHLAEEVEGTPNAGRLAILGALTLYLDFINLFIFLLRLLGQRR